MVHIPSKSSRVPVCGVLDDSWYRVFDTDDGIVMAARDAADDHVHLNPARDSYKDAADLFMPSAICQLPDEKHRKQKALYFRFKSASWANAIAIMNKPLQGGEVGRFENHMGILRAMPAVLKKCEPAEDELLMLNRLDALIRSYDLHTESLLEDPTIGVLVAPRIAERILSEFAPYGLQAAEEKLYPLIERFVGLAIGHGVAEEDLFGIASDLYRVTPVEDFPYAFAAASLLRVARDLHSRNKMKLYRRGISYDFDEFATAVERDLRNGSLKARVRTIGECMDNIDAAAVYDPSERAILVGAMSGDESVTSMLSTYIHEPYHHFELTNGSTYHRDRLEGQAYERGFGAAYLYSGDGLYPAPEEQAARTAYREKSEELEDNREACRYGSYADLWAGFRWRMSVESGLARAAWVEATRAEIDGSYRGNADSFFRAYYGIERLEDDRKGGLNRWMNVYGKNWEDGRIGRLRRMLRRGMKDLADYSAHMYSAGCYVEQGVAAQEYSSELFRLTALAYFVDERAWESLTEEYYRSADFVGDVLLSYPENARRGCWRW